MVIRKSRKFIFAVIILLVCITSNIGADERVNTYIIEAGGMLDVSTGKIIRDVRLLVIGDEIISLKAKKTPKGASLIKLNDAILLPGLIDSHTHITWQLNKSGASRSFVRTLAEEAIQATIYAKKTLQAGFTTLRECGSRNFLDVSLKRSIDAGIVPGPRIIPAAHAIGITGGHGDASGYKPGIMERDWRHGVANGRDEVIKAVRYQIKHGAQSIKVMATAGVLSFEKNVGAQQMTLEEMRAAVEEAKRHGIKVAAHAHGTEGILAAVKAGVASVEHGSILNDEALKLMKEKGTFLVPTVYVTKAIPYSLLPPLLRSKAQYMTPIMRKSFKRALKFGIKIAFGTDAGVFPHGQNAREFATMVELGMEPLRAIQAATLGAAELLGLKDRGLLKKGFKADIIAVKGNPLKNIKTMEQVIFVMKGGTPVRRPE